MNDQQGESNERLVPRFLGWGTVASVFVVLLFASGAICLRRYQPPGGTTTIDQLVGRLPETLKFALVTSGNRTFVVWIGRSRGVVVSGPPVYVFDEAGSLVDRVYDAGDSDNAFVVGLYGEAFRGAGMTAGEALAYCKAHRKVAPPVVATPP